LPELIKKRAADRRLEIWCGASSTGQEPYTIAMILREHFPSSAAWNVRIIATDLSNDVLDRAREGRYNQIEVNRGLPAALLVKYFQRRGTEWKVAAWDIVFLRNVLIYFDVATKKSILAKIRHVLRPDGFLFLGGAETTMNLDAGFERAEYERAGCYRLKTS
jgi:chemotaxis protein methyltransferase CheR